MHNDNYIIRKGKRLAFLLRHDKEAFEQGRLTSMVGAWPELKETSADELDSILYDKVKANAGLS